MEITWKGLQIRREQVLKSRLIQYHRKRNRLHVYKAIGVDLRQLA